MFRILLISLAFAASAAQAQDIDFGNNSSDYARDGACDDRRFFGPGMGVDLDWEETRRDAADCRQAFRRGTIKLWDQAAATAATQCRAIDFGANGSEWANDDECDDPRFEGRGTSPIMNAGDEMQDAADCRAACAAGTIFIRNY